MIQRDGTTTGRWPKYVLSVDGANLGRIERTIARGCDRMMGRRQSAWDGWRAGGKVSATREEAERHLIGRQLTVINPTLTPEQARAALAELIGK
jgi:hypothetical protein